jgi:hypothetical protein
LQHDFTRSLADRRWDVKESPWDSFRLRWGDRQEPTIVFLIECFAFINSKSVGGEISWWCLPGLHLIANSTKLFFELDSKKDKQRIEY